MNEDKIPSHLPRRLAICYYGWDWFTSALPDETYGDLDRAMRETKERGFNCIRPDLGLGIMFDLHGNRRKPVEFRGWISGASDNLQCVDGKGGGVHDIFERVMHLFELAEKHDLYIIGTSWIYQDFIAQLADIGLRDEIIGVPTNQRLMLIAKQWDLLVTELKRRGLIHRLAMLELVNEMNGSALFIPYEKSSIRPTFAEWTENKDWEWSEKGEGVRELATEAIGYLLDRHPDVLTTVDFSDVESMRYELPDRGQVADHHVYVPGVTQAVWEVVGKDKWDLEIGPNPDEYPVLKSLLKPDVISWESIRQNALHVRSVWRANAWFYQNLDNDKYDEYCLSISDELKPGIQEDIDWKFTQAEKFASERRLPLVIDEGYILYPPLNSKFVATPAGRWSEFKKP